MRKASQSSERTWASAAWIALAFVAVATAASALINPLLGRTVHWDIVAVLMPMLFVVFTVVFKKRWA